MYRTNTGWTNSAGPSKAVEHKPDSSAAAFPSTSPSKAFGYTSDWAAAASAGGVGARGTSFSDDMSIAHEFDSQRGKPGSYWNHSPSASGVPAVQVPRELTPHQKARQNFLFLQKELEGSDNGVAEERAEREEQIKARGVRARLDGAVSPATMESLKAGLAQRQLEAVSSRLREIGQSTI